MAFDPEMAAAMRQQLVDLMRHPGASEMDRNKAESAINTIDLDASAYERNKQAAQPGTGDETGVGEAAARLGAESIVPGAHATFMPLGATIGEHLASVVHPELTPEPDAFLREQGRQMERLGRSREEHPGIALATDIGGAALGAKGALSSKIGQKLAPKLGASGARAISGATAGGIGGAEAIGGSGGSLTDVAKGAGMGALFGSLSGIPRRVGGAVVMGGAPAATELGSQLASDEPMDTKSMMLALLAGAVPQAIAATPWVASRLVRRQGTQLKRDVEGFEAGGGRLTPTGPKMEGVNIKDVRASAETAEKAGAKALGERSDFESRRYHERIGELELFKWLTVQESLPPKPGDKNQGHIEVVGPLREALQKKAADLSGRSGGNADIDLINEWMGELRPRGGKVSATSEKSTGRGMGDEDGVVRGTGPTEGTVAAPGPLTVRYLVKIREEAGKKGWVGVQEAVDDAIDKTVNNIAPPPPEGGSAFSQRRRGHAAEMTKGENLLRALTGSEETIKREMPEASGKGRGEKGELPSEKRVKAARAIEKHGSREEPEAQRLAMEQISRDFPSLAPDLKTAFAASAGRRLVEPGTVPGAGLGYNALRLMGWGPRALALRAEPTLRGIEKSLGDTQLQAALQGGMALTPPSMLLDTISNRKKKSKKDEE